MKWFIKRIYRLEAAQETQRPKRKSCLLFFVALVGVLFCSLLSVDAADGTGKTAPLALESSSIADGDTEVDIGREIKLVFSKNISNITVKENNLTCFSMKDSFGKEIPLEVVLFDDQLEREKRNDVILVPTDFRAAKKYVLTVSKKLRSKNGATLDQDLVIRFSTTGYKSDSETGQFPVVLIVPIVFLFISIAYFMNQKKHAE